MHQMVEWIWIFFCVACYFVSIDFFSFWFVVFRQFFLWFSTVIQISFIQPYSKMMCLCLFPFLFRYVREKHTFIWIWIYRLIEKKRRGRFFFFLTSPTSMCALQWKPNKLLLFYRIDRCLSNRWHSSSPNSIIIIAFDSFTLCVWRSRTVIEARVSVEQFLILNIFLFISVDWILRWLLPFSICLLST